MPVRFGIPRTVAVALALAGIANTGAPATAQGVPSLDAALKDAARRSGREVIYPAEVVAGRRAPAVDVDSSPDDVVRALLRGTGLEAEFRPGVIIVRLPPGVSAGLVQDGGAGGAEVVVTGTRIRGAQATSPVTVTDRREIEAAGLPDLGEVVRRLPQNFGGGQNPNVTGGGNQGGNINATGSSNVNLRGLGEDATLTLINGHRVAYDGVSQGIDISAIPVAAISRVEVVTDGASALYGSDAVGGVVNVILRSDYEGLLTTGRAGVSLAGGNEQVQFSAVAGTRWKAGGLMLAGDLNYNGSVEARQRSFTSAQDPSLTLFPWRRQVSAIAVANQRVGGVTLAVDAQYARRESRYANAFQTTGGATANGLLNNPVVVSHAVSPSLRLNLPAGWSATLAGTESRSLAELRNESFSQSVRTDLDLSYDNRLRTGEVGAEGPVLGLAGGEARLAMGAGVRSTELRIRNASTSGGVTRVTADYGGDRHVAFAYGELSLPLFGPGNGRPFFNRLRVDVAARYEDYQDVKGVIAPKIGVVYEPISWLSLKGTWGRSFKAPTLFQEFQPRQGPLLPSGFFAGAPANRTVLLLAGGGNPLAPERAETWSGTLEVRPSSGLTLAATYYDVQYRDRVANPIASILNSFSDPRYANFLLLNPTRAQLDAIVATLPQGISNQTGQSYDPAGVVAVINAGLTNVARQSARGADVRLDYRATLSGGARVGVTAAVSYLESDQQSLPGQAAIQRAGTIFDPPHYQGRGGATWERGGLTLAGFVTYTGENLDDRFVPTGTVGSFVTVDGSIRFRTSASRGPLSGIEAGVTVLNLLDERPDRIPNLNPAAPPYDSSNGSILGRTVSVTITKAW